MSKTKREFWGLDLETSGSSHETSAPIQLGLYAPDGAVFRSDIGGWHWDYRHVWSEEAFGIHNITKERLSIAPDRYEVQRMAMRFVEEHSAAWRGERLPVGWNVASFDMPFIRDYLPALSNVMSYRSVDLNAVVYATAEAHGLSSKELKIASKTFAEETLKELWPEEGPAWHDAAYDAAAAIHSMTYLTMVIQTGRLA